MIGTIDWSRDDLLEGWVKTRVALAGQEKKLLAYMQENGTLLCKSNCSRNMNIRSSSYNIMHADTL